MHIDDVLSLLANLSRPLASELTREQAVGFFLAFLHSGFAAKRAQAFIVNAHGDPVTYPPDGESGADGCDVSIDVIEQAMSSGQIVIAGHDIVIPLAVEPRPFGVIVVQEVKNAPDQRMLLIIGTLASGLLCCGRPPQV